MRFADFLFERLPGVTSSAEPFAAVAYEAELRAKNDALRVFWQAASLPGAPKQIIPAVVPRNYRTTSKRRVTVHGRSGVSLGFAESKAVGAAVSALDLAAHNRIYHAIYQKLSTPAFGGLARALNWIILRGDLDRRCLILNICRMDGQTVRKAKLLAERLAEAEPCVTAALLYFDPTRSDYYLTAERPRSAVDLKHLFGPRLLTLKVDGLNLKYPPTAFSQVNEAMVPSLVKTARELLQVRNTERLIDLYCGYGLFSFALGREAAETLGMELTGESIATAVETARRQFAHARFRFIPTRITDASLAQKLPTRNATLPEVVLLDPPRQGAAPGVIETIAARKPARVLQICCGTDEIVPAVRTWISTGYRVDTVQPMDLFPGTAGLETLILLSKA